MICIRLPIRLVVGKSLISPHIPSFTVAAGKQFDVWTAGTALDQGDELIPRRGRSFPIHVVDAPYLRSKGLPFSSLISRNMSLSSAARVTMTPTSIKPQSKYMRIARNWLFVICDRHHVCATLKRWGGLRFRQFALARHLLEIEEAGAFVNKKGSPFDRGRGDCPFAFLLFVQQDVFFCQNAHLTDAPPVTPLRLPCQPLRWRS